MGENRNANFFYIVALLFLCSCATQKQLNTIERLNAEVTEFEKYNLFETDHFTVHLPKTWKTYLEPSVKEQIRHSPINSKGKIDQSEYLWLMFFASDNPKESVEKIGQTDYASFYRPKYTKQKYTMKKGEDHLGSFIRTQFELLPEFNGAAFTIRHYYYFTEGGYLLVRMYFKTKGNTSSEMEIAKESIRLRK